MPPKRKRVKVPKSCHHPSQSSIDVPSRLKEEIKGLQDNRCWLCDCKAHKTLRPLQICHIYPQAISQRFSFEEAHKLGRIQLHNIHDRGNLLALCSICHWAFDCNHWTFIPEDTEHWRQRIELRPQIIQEYNSQRNIVYRRLLLVPDPYSEAFRDTYYKSAFTDKPTKVWPGEPGVVIMRPVPAYPQTPTAELRKTLGEFAALKELWLEYKGLCPEEKCPICQNSNEDDDENEGHGKEDDEEDDEEDGEEDDGEDDEEDDEEDDGDDSEDDNNKDEDGDNDLSSSGKTGKRSFKSQLDSAGQQPILQDFDTKKPIQANKRRKKPRNPDRDWMTSAPYDKSIPYSHRYGYTWAGSTSNELMQLWQAYRKPVEN
ncbi:hypothetical protein JMJ35_006431 [Cladonia borealis]|uniref:HNH nuclease domain-containing protein n=1 Tax=Cladonia borealis TaxID=184061 RepID=A0AA39QYZ9_9LECA|nr:hypothetical protein JMJ35_006431 [Cladonia borealis]